MENVKASHGFSFEEAINFENQLDSQTKLPGKFHRAHQGNLESQLTSENYYKGSLSVPTMEDITQEFKIYSHNTPKLVNIDLAYCHGTAQIQHIRKHHADLYRSDLANPDTLSAQFHW